MKDIMVARIDDRLIHGQVVTAWIKSYPINNILIIDDLLAQDQMMQSIYKAAAPVGVKSPFWAWKTLASYWAEPLYPENILCFWPKGPRFLKVFWNTGSHLPS